jgi:hypothetical protein
MESPFAAGARISTACQQYGVPVHPRQGRASEKRRVEAQRDGAVDLIRCQYPRGRTRADGNSVTA